MGESVPLNSTTDTPEEDSVNMRRKKGFLKKNRKCFCLLRAVMTLVVMIFDWYSVLSDLYRYMRQLEETEPLYWQLGLPFLFLPGILLVVVVVCHYVRGDAKCSCSNLVGVLSLVVLYPVWVWIHSLDEISCALYGTWNNWRWEELSFPYTKHLILFILVEVVSQLIIRLVFDHSTTNILPNIGLISPLLISFVLFVRSTEEVTAEKWQEVIKGITEVATTNLKKNRETLKTGAEDVESNNNPVETGAVDVESHNNSVETEAEERRDSCGWRECWSSLTRRLLNIPVVSILLTLLQGLWPLGDIASDFYSVWDYYDRYMRGLVNTSLFYQFGFAFIFIPGIIYFIWGLIHHYQDEWKTFSWRWLLVEILSIPFFPAWVVFNSLYTAVNTLQGNVTQANINHTKTYKIIEMLCKFQCLTI